MGALLYATHAFVSSFLLSLWFCRTTGLLEWIQPVPPPPLLGRPEQPHLAFLWKPLYGDIFTRLNATSFAMLAIVLFFISCPLWVPRLMAYARRCCS